MLLTLESHTAAHWIARMKLVRFDEAELVVPGVGPVATAIAG